MTQADELLVTEIAPLCMQLTSQGYISRWWFLRKGDGVPHLRLRVFGEEPTLSNTVVLRVEEVLGNIESSGRIAHWTSLCYEPETMVFGGAQGMEAAHDLFHKDSLALCQWLAVEQQLTRENSQSQAYKRRAEASLLVIQRLLRGAELDIFEQWDVWTRMANLRPWTTTAGPAQRKKNTTALAYLLFEASQHQLAEVFGDELYAVVSAWGEHFEQTGRALAQLNREGSLARGLREILASHIIFHWNRSGFGVALQAELPRLVEMVYRERCAFSQGVHT